MHQDTYLAPLRDLVSLCRSMPNTPMTAKVRIVALAGLALRYTPMIPDRNLPDHPYRIMAELIADARAAISAWETLPSWAESETRTFDDVRHADMETMHEGLFSSLWTQYSVEEFKNDRIARYVHRIDFNDLRRNVDGKRCIDFGCGHGNFAHALLERGASFVLGLDYGEGNIAYADRMREALGVPQSKLTFRRATVYETGEPDDAYDFAIQNGVFHHLDDEDRAYREVFRVLKPGGTFWVYTDGEGAISHHMWDSCRLALENVPPHFIIAELKALNLRTGLRYHLGDGFNAVYRHTNFKELEGRLKAIGFETVRRLKGGCDTDFDPEVIADDRWGREKFGEGDIRVLMRKPA